MCALTENTDMARDMLDRVYCVACFLEEALDRGPDHGLELSRDAAEGLLYVVRDVGLAARRASEADR